MTMLYLGSMQQGPKAITSIMLECSFYKKNSKKKSMVSKFATTCNSSGCLGLHVNKQNNKLYYKMLKIDNSIDLKRRNLEENNMF